MRVYKDGKEPGLEQAVCNCCGRSMKIEKGILKEECIRFSIPFGYFSNKDGETHQFDLCEECYDKLIQNFRIPVEKKEETELL